MRVNKVKEMWQAGQAPAMAWLSTPDPYIAEAIANAGFDAVVLDMQHGMTIGPDRAGTWLQAIGTTDTVPIVRVPWNEPFFIQWVLDAGALGVIVPLVNSREEAAKAGGACRYPPAGYRSVGQNRARFYGADYIQRANDEIICLVMVENIDTIPHLEEMVQAPGIDGFYIGPSDLGLTMGMLPSVCKQNADHAAACQRVLDVARAHNLVAGIHCMNPDEAVQRHRQGFVFCPAMMDLFAISTTAQAALQTLHDAES